MKFFLQKLITEEVARAFKNLNEGVVHLEKLSPQKLLNFLKAWNLDKAKFHVSEKIDGSYRAAGIDNGRFYLRSKTQIWYSAEEIPDLYFMTSFKKYFELLSEIPWAEIGKELSEEFGFEFTDTLEVAGEAVPTYDHNIVIYDEAKIGNGILVIFNMKTSVSKDNTGVLSNPKIWESFANKANKYSKVKFFSVPNVDLHDLDFSSSIIVSLEDIIEKHGNFLSKPARKPAEKELKQKLLKAIQDLGLEAKQQILQKNVSSKFGDEVEGIVVKNPEGELLKIVDTEKFLKKGDENRRFLKMLESAIRTFKKDIKNDPENIEKYLSAWEEEIHRAEEDFKKTGQQWITIPRKVEDTKNDIKLNLGFVKAIKNKLSQGIPPKEVAEMFMKRELLPEQKLSKTLHFLTEGGNVFDEMNSVVPKALLEPAIANALKNSGLGGIPFNVVGNKTKEFFNDIDVAIDGKDLAKFLGVSSKDKKNIWSSLDRLLQTSDAEKYSINKGLSQFHILAPLVDSSNKQINNFLSDGSRGDEPGFIQVDIFVGNLQWMTDVNSGAPKDSSYKARDRNKLLSNIAREIKLPTENEDEYIRFVLNFRDGMRKQKIKTVLPTGRQKNVQKIKLSDEPITTDPNEMAKIFFGRGTTWEDINSYEKLMSMLLSKKFRYKKFIPNILHAYKKEVA